MLSKEKTRKILRKTKISDEQFEKLQKAMYALAEIFFEELSSSSGSKQHSWVIDSNAKNNGH